MGVDWKTGIFGRLRLTAEILGWQVGTKLISIFAFAHAAKCLGPEKFGISGVVLSGVWQVTTVSSLLNEAFLSRRYRRSGSHVSRQALITAATSGRLFLACLVGIPALILGLIFAPNEQWWLSIVAAGPFVTFIFLQPNWLLVGQDATNVIWRSAGIGSLVNSAFLFALRPGHAPAGIDVVALALSAGGTMLLAWKFGLSAEKFRFRLSCRHLRFSFKIIQASGWLFVTYFFANIYLYLDTFLLGVLGNSTDAGVYRPASNLAASLYQSANFLPLLLYPKFLDWAKNPDFLWRRQLQIGGGLMLLALCGVGAVSLVTEPIFRAMYGQAYVAASGPFVVLVAARALSIVSTVFTWGLIASDSDKKVGLIFCVGAFSTVTMTVMWIPDFGIWAPAWGGLCGDAAIFALAFAASWKRIHDARMHP